MTVRVEKEGAVWTVIHDRPEARNAMDPKSADDLTAAFLDFDADKDAAVAVFYGAGGAFCAGWDLKYVSTLNAEYPLGELDIPPLGTRGNGGEIPRGPTRSVAPRARQACDRRDRGAGRRRRHGAGPMVRFPGHGRRGPTSASIAAAGVCR